MYDYKFQKTKENILSKLNNAYKNRIDFLIIIGFKKNNKLAWIRCIDLKTKSLILMQINIKGKSIQGICEKIIKRMSTKDQAPFK